MYAERSALPLPGGPRSHRPAAPKYLFTDTLWKLVVFLPSPSNTATRPRSSGDRASASGAVCAGSNPAGGTSHEVPKDPAISESAEDGVFAYAQAYAARSNCVANP